MDSDIRAEKVRENRLRRMATRQGLKLEKSHLRDPRAIGYGTWQVVDARTNTVAWYGLPDGYGLTTEQVEEALDKGFLPIAEGRPA